MLYAQTNNAEHVPLGWEEVEHLFKRLHQLSYVEAGVYQLSWERRMFSMPTYPEVRLTLIRWTRKTAVVSEHKREEVAIAYHPREMVPVLLMLIAVAEDKEKEIRAKGDEYVKWV
jgi:hypothetical protein